MIKTLTEKAIENLEHGRISQALDSLKAQAKKDKLHEYAEKAQELKDSYLLMLDYFAEGTDDPERTELLSKLNNSTYNLIDMEAAERYGRMQKIDISQIDYNDLPLIFGAIENNFPHNREDRKYIQRLILDDNIPHYIRGMIVSALTLNLLKHFDNEKFESLYTYTFEDLPMAIRARAWVGIVLVAMAHDIRISTQSRLVEQLKFLCEEEKQILLTIQATLFQSLRGKDVRNIFRGEIASNIEKGLREMKRRADDEEDIAPLWEEFMEKSGIQKKVRQFLDLQKDGVDIMYDSFVQLKKVAFYDNKCNWFLPFDPEFPLFKPILMKNGAKADYIKIIAKAGNMCSTDKYSNMLMSALIPEEQFENVKSALKVGNVSVDNVLDASFEDEIIGYIHDLFRYYTLFEADEFEPNPFEQPLFFGSYFGLEYAVADKDVLLDIANLLIENENWEEAVEVMKFLVEKDESEINLQRFAFCLNKNDEHRIASLSVLAKCNFLYPGNKWTMKNYAKSLDAIGDFCSEESLLREGCRLFPKDTGFILSLAECLMNQERFEEALELYFKADMMKEDNFRTCRYLAFCAFALGNGELAEKYIAKTLKMQKAEDIDYIHGGHIALLNGDIPLAIKRYAETSAEELDACFEEESELIFGVGISFDTISLAFEAAILRINS